MAIYEGIGHSQVMHPVRTFAELVRVALARLGSANVMISGPPASLFLLFSSSASDASSRLGLSRLPVRRAAGRSLGLRHPCKGGVHVCRLAPARCWWNAVPVGGGPYQSDVRLEKLPSLISLPWFFHYHQMLRARWRDLVSSDPRRGQGAFKLKAVGAPPGRTKD